MQIINYFDYDDKTSIISQLEILQGEWRAIGFLLSLLKEGTFHIVIKTLSSLVVTMK